MLADGEQNLFGRHGVVREIFVPRPASHFSAADLNQLLRRALQTLSAVHAGIRLASNAAGHPAFGVHATMIQKPNQSAVRSQALESGRRVMRWSSLISKCFLCVLTVSPDTGTMLAKFRPNQFQQVKASCPP